MLQLREKAVLNRYVLPLPINHNGGKVNPGSVCSVAGWGIYKDYNKDEAPTLRKVDVKVVSAEICSKTFPNIDVKKFICAGDPQEKKYAYNVSIIFYFPWFLHPHHSQQYANDLLVHILF